MLLACTVCVICLLFKISCNCKLQPSFSQAPRVGLMEMPVRSKLHLPQEASEHVWYSSLRRDGCRPTLCRPWGQPRAGAPSWRASQRRWRRARPPHSSMTTGCFPSPSMLAPAVRTRRQSLVHECTLCPVHAAPPGSLPVSRCNHQLNHSEDANQNACDQNSRRVYSELLSWLPGLSPGQR